MTASVIGWWWAGEQVLRTNSGLRDAVVGADVKWVNEEIKCLSRWFEVVMRFAFAAIDTVRAPERHTHAHINDKWHAFYSLCLCVRPEGEGLRTIKWQFGMCVFFLLWNKIKTETKATPTVDSFESAIFHWTSDTASCFVAKLYHLLWNGHDALEIDCFSPDGTSLVVRKWTSSEACSAFWKLRSYFLIYLFIFLFIRSFI